MRFLLAVAALLSSLGLGCSVGLTAHLPELTLAVAPGSQGAILNVSGEQALGPQNTSSATSVQLDAVTFSALQGGTFDFLSEVHLWLSAPGLPEMEVASLTAVPVGATDITLEAMPDADVLPYLQNGCTLRVDLLGVVPVQSFSFDGVLQASVGI